MCARERLLALAGLWHRRLACGHWAAVQASWPASPALSHAFCSAADDARRGDTRRGESAADAPPPFPTYADLSSPSAERVERERWRKRDTAWLADVLDGVLGSRAVRSRAQRAHVSADLLRKARPPFARWLQQRLPDDAKRTLAALPPGHRQAAALLWPLLRGFLGEHYGEDVAAQEQAARCANMSKPHLWFPAARELARKVIYHAGPTNSGKTHAALQALKAARSGLYCGPLRLLAVEVHDRLNADGCACSLLTGQERVDTPGAGHVACTVEMASLSRDVEVAVIDEIQLMADQQRGWAWTKALLGLRAAEVHVCGDYSVLELVRRLCADMDDEFELREYSRMTRLEVEGSGLGRAGYRGVQAGDCIVAFARKDIYSIKAAVERETGFRACVIYGALPPETRRAQAALFNDPASPFSVLVASDAVGLGLNLNIRRVVFHSMRKYNRDTRATEVLHPSVVKQIAGRAGRRGTAHAHGLVTTLWNDELPYLRAALDVPLDAVRLPAAGLLPEYEQLEVYAQSKGYPEACSLPQLIDAFAAESKQDASYFLCNQQDMVDLAKSIDAIHPLTLQERFTLCKAPVDQRNGAIRNAFLFFATKYAKDGVVELDIDVPRKPPTTWPQINHCEAVHAIASIWLWLSFRFGDAFVRRDAVQAATQQLSQLVNQGLQVVSADGACSGADEYRSDIYGMIRTAGLAHSAGDVARGASAKLKRGKIGGEDGWGGRRAHANFG